MELYHKQLNSVAELRRERKRLKIDRKVADHNAEEVEHAKEQDSPLASFISLAGDFLSSKGTKNAFSSLAMPLFSLALGQTKQGFLKKVAKEVIGGYIKWKAIDFGVTLAMRFIRMQTHKAEKKED